MFFNFISDFCGKFFYIVFKNVRNALISLAIFLMMA